LAETGLPALAPTQPAYAEYTIQPGDTLAGIATRFHVTVQELVAFNKDRYPTLATNPGLVRVGWQLRIPSVSGTAGPTAAPTTIGTPGNDAPHADLNETAQRIVEGVNAARAGQGLALLRYDATLTQIASQRSADMIRRGYFSHNDPQTGQEALLHEIQVLKYTYQYVGENIAELKNDAGWVPPLLTVAARYSAADLANEFVHGWLNSPEHRANIVNAHYRRTGVALAFSQDGRRIVATQIFSD
jgi:uncharacterized protein YkwD